MVQIKGLTGNRYMINNPIWVDIENMPSDTVIMASFTEVDLSAETEAEPNVRIRLRANAQGKAYFDLSKVVKAIMKEPKHPIAIPQNAPIGTNYINIKIVFSLLQVIDPQNPLNLENYIFTKMFIRAGQESMASNITLSQNAVLKESDKLLRWQGYPLSKYYIQGSVIRATNIIPNDEVRTMRHNLTENPVYLRFKNTKGGYSFWLFETYRVQIKTSQVGEYKRRNETESLGAETTYTLKTETRVEKEYYKTMRALLMSPEIHVWNLAKVLFPSNQSELATSAASWSKVIANNSSLEQLSFEDLQDFSFDFDVKLTLDTRVAW